VWSYPLIAEMIELHYMATWWDVLRVCRENDYFDASTLAEIIKFSA